eukprot:1145349-Pelagomonas_calceolata.AAC.7
MKTQTHWAVQLLFVSSQQMHNKRGKGRSFQEFKAHALARAPSFITPVPYLIAGTQQLRTTGLLEGRHSHTWHCQFGLRVYHTAPRRSLANR